MNIFDLHQRVIDDYKDFSTSFIQIKDSFIADEVNKELADGRYWPEPLVQLNPFFEQGRTIEQLVSVGEIHPECGKIFRNKSHQGDFGSTSLKLHWHQEEALRLAKQQHNYIVTTGTGSGKSLTYIIPIVNSILQRGAGKGIQAIIVYPMNALANSQFGELKKFLSYGFPEGQSPVRFARYTGQENDAERMQIANNPPDILITNYVMMELLLTRIHDDKVIKASKGLSFLVLDELHTYRGRQGADVSMLVRRVRDRCETEHLQCIGTSATMSTDGSYDEQRQTVANVARNIFGADFMAEDIIGERLQRITNVMDFASSSALEQLCAAVSQPDQTPTNFETFTSNALASWLEDTLGIRYDHASGRYVRQLPKSIGGKKGVAQQLAELTGESKEQCEQTVKNYLLRGYELKHPEADKPIFAFKLHAFISKGDTVYASLETDNKRVITLHAQRFVPGDRSKALLPLAFCRECGQEYYVVKPISNKETGAVQFIGRELSDREVADEDEHQAGFLFVNSRVESWSDTESEMIDRLPDSWLEQAGDHLRIVSRYRKDLPKKLKISLVGEVSGDDSGHEVYFIKAPLPFCLHCGISHDRRRKSDFARLGTLGSEGRSTATTILSTSVIRHLEEMPLAGEAKKLLSFTDNRQDASLQAGHFNDFVDISFLRSALLKALADSGDEGILHDQLSSAVTKAMSLGTNDFAIQPDVRFSLKQRVERALHDVIGYRLYIDLRGGWRIMSPNLEQTGLLQFEYESLLELCEDHSVWNNKHEALTRATPATRFKIAKVLLDHLRRNLAIKVSYLDVERQESIRQNSYQLLVEPFALDEYERMISAASASMFRRNEGEEEVISLSSRSAFGQYLRRRNTFTNIPERLRITDSDEITAQLLAILTEEAGILEKVSEDKYRINAASIIWRLGSGETIPPDPLRVQSHSQRLKINPYFRDFYREVAGRIRHFEAREHTAQVSNELRAEREKRFSEADLSVLYCSPTMELGVDIRQLNVVNMRNVPPTPANYAQRSGRAGRSGQPALVFTYCTIGNNHDQYFFKRREKMVSGTIAPPRIDLSNPDLIASHIRAVWLEESGMDLGKSLQEVIDITKVNTEEYPIFQEKRSLLTDEGIKRRARQRAVRVLRSLSVFDGEDAIETRVDHVLRTIETEFEKSCERWLGLFRATFKQIQQQRSIMDDVSRSQRDREQANRLHQQAFDQQSMLLDTSNVMQSDFYSYRYFASEGFLPGYNFPRLPLSAFIPGRRSVRGGKNNFLSRPRFLAISEFGPRSVIYHEGNKYMIDRVILPLGDEYANGVPTKSVKVCVTCGYLNDQPTLDTCENCQSPLSAAMENLFRMQNVITRIRERINSDEEERMRLGYEIMTTIRYSNTELPKRSMLLSGGEPFMQLTYGHAATIWRVNKGWMRRSNKEQLGFILDLEKGKWAKNEQLEEDTLVNEESLGTRVARVVPYVEDRRNVLTAQWSFELSDSQRYSVQSALKQAVQHEYHLEDSELACEWIAEESARPTLLFYEASEGGAGVLSRLISDARAWRTIARRALELCHFDIDSGEDLFASGNEESVCEAACYDCLMNYGNQRVHNHLDRFESLELLRSVREVQLIEQQDGRDRYSLLMQACDSELERTFLNFLQQKQLRLPDAAQYHIPSCSTVVDFYYADLQTVIYVDGPAHNGDQTSEDDRRKMACLESSGYHVIRFRYDQQWEHIIQQETDVFGVPS